MPVCAPLLTREIDRPKQVDADTTSFQAHFRSAQPPAPVYDGSGTVEAGSSGLVVITPVLDTVHGGVTESHGVHAANISQSPRECSLHSLGASRSSLEVPGLQLRDTDHNKSFCVSGAASAAPERITIGRFRLYPSESGLGSSRAHLADLDEG
jgi:hypothetical protein